MRPYNDLVREVYNRLGLMTIKVVTKVYRKLTGNKRH